MKVGGKPYRFLPLFLYAFYLGQTHWFAPTKWRNSWAGGAYPYMEMTITDASWRVPILYT